MLADIPSRFSIQKSLSIGSPTAGGSPSPLGGVHSARGGFPGQSFPGTAAIPNGQDGDMLGMQSGTAGNNPQGPPCSHVTAVAGEMPRSDA